MFINNGKEKHLNHLFHFYTIIYFIFNFFLFLFSFFISYICLTMTRKDVCITLCLHFSYERGGRMVRWCWVNYQCRGVLFIWIIVEQGPIAGGDCSDIFSIVYHFFSFSLSLGDGLK